MDGRRSAAARRRVAAIIAVALSMVALTACESRRFVTGWLPHWMPSTSSESFLDGASLFEEVSPFRYATYQTPETIVPIGAPGAFDGLIAAARAEGVPVMPTIVDEFPARGMAAILADPTTRTRHVNAIVNLVMTRGYDGIDLDYETFAFGDGSSTWESLKPNWIAFVRQLGKELHAKEKLLAITVPWIIRSSTGALQGYWSYAWSEIEPAIDRLRIMVYDWGWSGSPPRAIAPIWWVRQVLSYAQSVMPMSKVQLGIPAYGREWTARLEGTCPPNVVPATESHTMREIPGLLAATGATPTRDALSGEMTFSYTKVVLVDPSGSTTTVPTPTSSAPPIEGPAEPGAGGVRLGQCVITREVWYPDATSWRTSATEALAAGASGVAIWALGYETDDAARAIADVSAEVTGPSGTSPVGRVTRPVVTSKGALRVTGWAFDPEGDLPIPVTITVTSLSDPAAAPVVRTLLARAPRPSLTTAYPGAGEFHGFRAAVRPPVPSGEVRVCVRALGRYAGPNDVRIGCRRVTLDAPN